MQNDILQDLMPGYQNAIRETKQSIDNEIHDKVKKSKELKRMSKSKPRKRKHNENKSLNVPMEQ